MISRIAARRPFLTISTLLFLEAVICTQIPLLNYLGYEFSLLNAIVAGFLSGLLAISFWLSRPPASDAESLRYVKGTVGVSLLAILVPLFVITINAFFVKNCSFAQGVRLYVLYVVPSVIFCVSLGLFSSVVAKKYKRTVFLILFALTLAHIPYVTLTRPQIFAFNPIAGYFPGFTYDETLQGEIRLLIYRAGVLALSAFLITISLGVHRIIARNFQRSDSKDLTIWYNAIIIACLVVCMGIYRIRDSIGLSSSEQYITKQLGGVQYTAHFRIVYPKKSIDADGLRRLVILHEYLFDQLREELQVNPRRLITVYIYESPQQKEQLIGAAGTDFTKPWLRQININLGDVESALKHELVHAMLAEQGIPVLQIAPNSGLIEGAAVAAEKYEYDEMLHRLAAEIIAVGIDPNVAEMFSLSGFFKAYPGVSYVMAGSFCRYLIDRYGIMKFKALYRSADFEGLYGKNVTSLVSEWKTVICSINLTRHDLVKAAYLFKRTPLYGKECARVIANLNAQTGEFINRKDYPDALASADRSLTLSRSVEAVFQKSAALFRMGKYQDLVEFAQQQLKDTTISYSLLPLRLTLGDSYWALNEYSSATSQYTEILSDSLSVSMNESATIRIEILADSPLRAAFKPYFTIEMDDSVRTMYLEALQESPESDVIARYLLGREYSLRNKNASVILQLRVLAPMGSPILEFVRNRRIARALYNLGNFELAKIYYWRALNYATNEALFGQIEEALQRCAWIQERLR